MATTTKGPVARVNAALLKKYQGQEVRFVGKYTGAASDGKTVSLLSTDNTHVTVHTTNPAQYAAAQYVEVVGTVHDAFSLAESRVLQYSAEFDPVIYNKAVIACATKFADMFTPVVVPMMS